MTLKEFFESKQLLAINLKTKEQVDIFSKEADKLGKKWDSGASYVEYTFWEYDKEETCYDNEGTCETICFYKGKCKVLNFEDIEWEEEKMNNFTKKDIKNGAVVELRNGQRYLKVDYTLLDINMTSEFINIEHYKDNLTTCVEEFDIMKVLNPEENILNVKCCNKALSAIKNNNFKWTWEREEKKKIKLKDLTFEQYKKWGEKNCHSSNCKECIFHTVSCGKWRDNCWIKNKDLYNEKFLNQEIELEE